MLNNFRMIELNNFLIAEQIIIKGVFVRLSKCFLKYPVLIYCGGRGASFEESKCEDPVGFEKDDLPADFAANRNADPKQYRGVVE